MTNKNNELALLYREYERLLAEGKWYDYADMIMEVLGMLQRDENLLLMLQEQYQYVLVDEHQDTNNAQNKIVELLCGFHQNPNIFVVGDEKQAIYRFQGASLENFLYFQKLYPSAELIVLEDNYRSTQIILDAAHGVIPGKKELKANARHAARPIRIGAFANEDAERYGIAQDIKEQLGNGVAPGDIAILYRNNRDAFPMMEMLERMEIPAAIESDQDIMRDDTIGKLVRILRAVNAFGSPEELIGMLHIDFLGIEPLDLYKGMEYANRNRISIYDVVRSEQILKDEKLRLEKPDVMRDIYGKMAQWNAAAKNKGLAESVEMIMRESGLLANILAGTEPVEKMEKLTAFFDEVKKMVEAHRDAKLSDLFVHLDTMERHGLTIKRSIGGHGAGKVRLMTAHRSKGLEFDHVYIINAFDTHWGNKKSRELLQLPATVFARTDAPMDEGDDENADERRLFYVALTRAKQTVTVTYAKENMHRREQLPSLFIGEIREDLCMPMATEPYEQELAAHKEVLFAPRTVTAVDIRDKEYIKELFMRNGLSATALNNYLTCPWRYFYSNLLRIPGAPEKHQMFGTAMHGALQDFFNALGERGADKQFLLDKFAYHLGRQALSGRDFEDAKKKGVVALEGYYDAYHQAWRGNVLTEYAISDVMLTPDIRLTGKIDKLEFIDAGNKVNVVDYKTGKPKSRSQIEGKAKEVEDEEESEGQIEGGGIKRQLVFYKILLDRQGKYDMVSADVDFVEPMPSGKYKKEMFEVVPEEVAALEKEIMRMGTEIIEGAFWEKRCDDPKCEYCALRDLMN
jgi:DNA helicase-2/ATP-dependent DNA helicase PcrA